MVRAETRDFEWESKGGPEIRRRLIRTLEKVKQALLTNSIKGGSESQSKPIKILEAEEW